MSMKYLVVDKCKRFLPEMRKKRISIKSFWITSWIWRETIYEKREIRGKRSARYQVRSARMRNLYGGESHFQHYRTPRQLLEEASCRPAAPRFQNDGIARAHECICGIKPRFRSCPDSSARCCLCVPVENSGVCLQLAKIAAPVAAKHQ